MNFNNVNDLMRYVKKVSRYPLEQVAIKVQEILKEYIMNNWYNREGFSPESYTRTYQFVNCLDITPVIETPSGYEIEIFFNTDKMFAVDRSEYGEWNQHMNVDGNDVKESIPWFIEQGNNSPIYNYEGIHMIENTVDYCKQYRIPVKEMIKELKKYGFKIK